MILKIEYAPVMELVDMRDLGSRAAMRVGSSPFRRTKKKDMTKGHVFLFGTPEGTRTPNIQNRNLTLYPIELRALIKCSIIIAGLPPVVKCYF